MTFVIVVLATVSYVLAYAALQDLVLLADIPADAASEAQRSLRVLAVSQLTVGLLLVGFAAATAFLLARQVTIPLRSLAAKVRGVAPGQWQTERTIHTGDEVEALDSTLVDMALRLQGVYEHQEQEIARRTEDLRKQYALDRTMLDSIRHGVIAVDIEGHVTLCNPAAAQLLGLHDVIGKSIEEVLPLHERRRENIEHPVRVCLQSGVASKNISGIHWSIRKTDDTFLPVMLTVSPLSDGTRLFGALAVFQDVTEERHLDYLKSEFISLASHQLRTPLSSIRWYAELLSDARDGFNEEQKSYVTEIDHAVRRMVTLLGSLLYAARMEDEDLRPAIQKIELGTVIAEMLQDAQELFEGSSVRYSLNREQQSVPVESDPVLLKVVLQNLIGNAVKYSTPNTLVTITVGSDDQNAILHVADQGVGIPEAEQSRIFEKFFRAANVRKMDTDGNGLGLSISKAIIDRLGGSLTFQSDEGKGTTFTLTVPLSPEAKAQSPTPRTQREGQ